MRCRVRAWSQLWLPTALVTVALLMGVVTLDGPNVCMVKQKYNITKRIKYRAPMSVRTYEWCLAVPPRCSRWKTEIRDLTRLETEERVAEVSVCCPGYKMKDVSCVPICPAGKTGTGCSDDCGPNRWGPNCVNECKDCAKHGACSPVTGECVCQEGWQGERCETMLTTSTTSTTPMEELLTTSKATTKPTYPSTTVVSLITTPRGSEFTTTIPITTRRAAIDIPSSTIPTTPKTAVTTQLTSTTKKPLETIPPTTFETINPGLPPVTPSNMTIFPLENTVTENSTMKITNKDLFAIYNTSASPGETSDSTYSSVVTLGVTEPVETSTYMSVKPNQNLITEFTTISNPVTKTIHSTVNQAYSEITRKPETTIKSFPTTMKFKPKEIWIRPAQKGESLLETKIKTNHDVSHSRHKSATKIEIMPNTTPKTIIVSIIPTSVSYATFKKIAMSTASYLSTKNSSTFKSHSKVTEGFTKSMFALPSTATPFTKPINDGTLTSVVLNATTSFITNLSKPTPHSSSAATRRTSTTKSLFVNNTTNSMSRTSTAVTPTLNSSNYLTMTTVSVINITSTSQRRKLVTENLSTTTFSRVSLTTEPSIKKYLSNTSEEVSQRNITTIKPVNSIESKHVESPQRTVTNNTNANVTNITDFTNTVTTNKPAQDEEKFHILTEPEHITAVMSEKETERSSVDLISVISIAGGVMMAVITVAVVIVMMERCRRPRYDDIRKINDIRMQVMIDNNDVPPPYVRSIFHTPLPEPPTSEKCHYQPLSTLDRNLKQFMRPVVVQTISPIMLENFRGILECHYDHLPRRSHDFATLQAHRTVTPSISVSEQQRLQRASFTESAIEAMKCEAKLDVIDTTTSEPLYAEIPCWRPPSEHAIEIMNVNGGEAVTEL